MIINVEFVLCFKGVMLSMVFLGFEIVLYSMCCEMI